MFLAAESNPGGVLLNYSVRVGAVTVLFKERILHGRAGGRIAAGRRAKILQTSALAKARAVCALGCGKRSNVVASSNSIMKAFLVRARVRAP